MEYRERHERLRLLVKKLNKERKTQAKKIDILCNDFISAQRDFIKRLGAISFAADFYESIVGTTNLNKLFDRACGLIEEQVIGATVALVLRQEEGFRLHFLKDEQQVSFAKQQLEQCLTSELVNGICRANRPCTLDDMTAMGLQGNPAMLNRISVVTLPLGRMSSPLGFILLCRSAQDGLTVDELNNVLAITPGLSRAIESCQALCHSVD